MAAPRNIIQDEVGLVAECLGQQNLTFHCYMGEGVKRCQISAARNAETPIPKGSITRICIPNIILAVPSIEAIYKCYILHYIARIRLHWTVVLFGPTDRRSRLSDIGALSTRASASPWLMSLSSLLSFIGWFAHGLSLYC